MSATHLHLVLNHVPILGIPFGIALLLMGVLRHSEELKRAALVTFSLFSGRADDGPGVPYR